MKISRLGYEVVENPVRDKEMVDDRLVPSKAPTKDVVFQIFKKVLLEELVYDGTVEGNVKIIAQICRDLSNWTK